MKVRIGGLEIIDPTMEELDELIKRYGGGSQEEAPARPREHRAADPAQNGGSAADPVLLRRLVEAGEQGCPARDVGEMLGRRGRATRRAARAWAQRIGLVTEGNIDPFEDCRIGSQRGIRIRSSLMDVAEALLNRR